MERFFLIENQNSDDPVREIRIEPAAESDAESLAAVSRRAFEHDVNYGSPGISGPPGYDSPTWQRQAIKKGRYYKILEGDRIVGGFIVFPLDGEKAELGRVFIEPDCQNRGIGGRVLAFAESAFPRVRHWALDTPSWNLRTQYLYEKAGYVRVGEIDPAGRFTLIQYEKKLAE